eukprot:gene2960-4970_t
MKIIDGKKISEDIKLEVKGGVSMLKEKTGHVPGLATVLVGERKDSATYVRMKKKAALEVGIESIAKSYPADISQEDLLKAIKELNEDPKVHGILVQLPLPKHINEEIVLSEVSLHKDVDGFHPLNMGKLCMKNREPEFIPCTPKGIMELLDRNNIEISGKNAIVLGRSNIVGIPIAMLLLHRNATVQICHTKTEDVESKVKEADILIACCGVAEYVKGSWIKKDAVVIDVGMNAVDDKSKKSGYRLVGDVNFEEVSKIASYVSPVPGGVGPMTIASLLSNCLVAATHQLKEK